MAVQQFWVAPTHVRSTWFCSTVQYPLNGNDSQIGFQIQLKLRLIVTYKAVVGPMEQERRGINREILFYSPSPN